MKHGIEVVAGSVIGAGPLALAGCASSMVPEATGETDADLTTVIQKSLEANEAVKDVNNELTVGKIKS